MEHACLWLVMGDDGRWHPGIGDPTLIGWLTVVAYVYAAYAAFVARAASREASLMLRQAAPVEARNQRTLVWLWSVVTLLLVVLGVNKQLDLQSYFTEVARDLASSQGWYVHRRVYQREFIVGVAAAGALGTLTLAWLVRRIVWRVMGCVLGVGFLVSFVAVRAASFHHVDLLLSAGPVKLNWVLELTGIALIARSAWHSARAVRPPEP